tara:strand:+ start:210 stop:593 length:384 start_codon:yes stop_codon:yes gene_type:complete
MSHFSTIKTKLKDRDALLKALLVMGLPVDVNRELENPVGHEHAKVHCDITLGSDIGFRWNRNTETYELVTDIQTWNHSIPPRRMIDKISQEYAAEIITRESKKKGFEVERKVNSLENEVEIFATRWV